MQQHQRQLPRQRRSSAARTPHRPARAAVARLLAPRRASPAARRAATAAAAGDDHHHHHHQQQLLPPYVWHERRRLLEELRDPRDRSGRAARLRRVAEREVALLPPGAAAAEAYEAEVARLRVAAAAEQRARLAHALASGLRVVVDCAWAQPQPLQPALDEQLAASGQARRSLAKQVELCVAANKRAAAPVQLTVTSWAGELAAHARDRLGAAGWGRAARLHEQALLEVLPDRRALVLLSPDAPEPLRELDGACAYVVAGIIDRTVRRGLSLRYAQAHGLAARRLPIVEHAAALGLDFPGASLRPALSVSDVVIALLEFHARGDWAAALAAGLPARRRRRHGQGARTGAQG